MKLKIFTPIYLISLATLLYSGFYNIRALNIIFKIITSILFVILPFITNKQPKTEYFKRIVLGLILACIGDIFLVIDKSKGLVFTLGVGSFAIAHLAYITAFHYYENLKFSNIWKSLIMYIPLSILINFTKLFNFEGLQIIVNLYAFIISLMFTKSLDLLKYYKINSYFVIVTIISTLLFFVSDFILLFAFFGINCNARLEVLNNFIYYIGQSLFGLSFIKFNKKNNQ